MVEEENNRLKNSARIIKSPKKKLAWGSPTKVNLLQENSTILKDEDLPPLGLESQIKKSRKAATPKKIIAQPK